MTARPPSCSGAGGSLLPLFYPIVAGLSLIGPVAALGIYELSRRREQGRDVSWVNAFDVLRSPALGSVVALGLMFIDFELLGGTSPLRHAIEAMFVTNAVRRRVRLGVLYAATALAYVAEGIGVGLVDAFAAHAPRPGVTLRRFAPTIRFHFAALTPEQSVSAALRSEPPR